MTVQVDLLTSQMQKALAGDRAAYAEALRLTAQLLRPYLSKRLNSAAEVDDLLQEILISVHKARHTYDGERPFKPWVFAIARFRLQDHLRAHYADPLRHAVDWDEIEESVAADVTESAISYESITAQIGQLPEKQATILQMMHQEGYTAREVGDRLGMKESAVKVAAHRAYKVLRKLLDR